MSAPIKVELFDLGPHNGMGEPDVKGSYHAFTLADKGGEGDWPQSLTFMVPAHQLPTRADLCTPTDERVKSLEAALQTFIYETTHLSPLEDDGSHWCKISAECLEKGRAALRDMGEG